MKIILLTRAECIDLRKKMKLTQEELARLLQYAPNHIAKLESGHVPLSMPFQLGLYNLARKKHMIDERIPFIEGDAKK